MPDNPPRGYFNYDPEDNDYGPRRWSRVTTSQHPLQEFTWATGYGPFQGHLEDKEPLLNRCGAPDRRQSPKDLTSTGGVPCALLDDRLCDCDAHHEIRTKVRYVDTTDFCLFVCGLLLFVVVFIETKTNDLVVIDLNTRVHAISLWYFSVVIKDCLRRTSPVKFYRK